MYKLGDKFQFETPKSGEGTYILASPIHRCKETGMRWVGLLSLDTGTFWGGDENFCRITHAEKITEEELANVTKWTDCNVERLNGWKEVILKLEE